MNSEQLESEILRLATEETKIVELQKKLDRKSAAWNALEVKRIEYSAHLAIYSIQLADIVSNTKCSSKMYGVEYSSDSNPRHLIRAGLRKAGVRPVPVEEPPKPSKEKKSGCTGFAVLILFAIVLGIILIGLHNSTDTSNKITRHSTSEPSSKRVQYEPKTSLPSPAQPPPHTYEGLLWPKLSVDAQRLIRHSVEVGTISSRYKFFKHLQQVRHEFPNWDDISQVQIAMIRATADTHDK